MADAAQVASPSNADRLVDPPALPRDTAQILNVAQKLDAVLTAGAPQPGDLKIKGLGEAVARVRSGILAARSAATGVDNSARAFVASANALAKQIDQARSDIEFEATQLGNSSGE